MVEGTVDVDSGSRFTLSDLVRSASTVPVGLDVGSECCCGLLGAGCEVNCWPAASCGCCGGCGVPSAGAGCGLSDPEFGCPGDSPRLIGQPPGLPAIALVGTLLCVA